MVSLYPATTTLPSYILSPFLNLFDFPALFLLPYFEIFYILLSKTY